MPRSRSVRLAPSPCTAATASPRAARRAAAHSHREPGGVTAGFSSVRQSHTGYALDDEGGFSEERTLTISKPSWATAKSRRTLLDHSGVWFEIVDGGFAGYYLPEIPGHSYIPGKLGQVIRYSPPRSVWLSPGSHTCYRFADDGATVAMTRIHVDATLEVQTSERAVINGETYRLLTDGELAGYWIPADAVSTSFGEDTGDG